jgi:hypothetical protein
VCVIVEGGADFGLAEALTHAGDCLAIAKQHRRAAVPEIVKPKSHARHASLPHDPRPVAIKVVAPNVAAALVLEHKFLRQVQLPERSQRASVVGAIVNERSVLPLVGPITRWPPSSFSVCPMRMTLDLRSTILDRLVDKEHRRIEAARLRKSSK